MFALGEMPDHEPQQVKILEHMQAEIEARLHMVPELQPMHPPHAPVPEAHVQHAPVEPASEAPATHEPLSFEQPTEPVAAQAPEHQAPAESFSLPHIPVEAMAETVELAVPEFQADEEIHLGLPQGTQETAEPALDLIPDLMPEPVVEVHEPVALPHEAFHAEAPAELPRAEEAAPEPVHETPHEQAPVYHTPEPVYETVSEHGAHVPGSPVAEAQPLSQVEIPVVESGFTREEIAAIDPALLALPKDELDADLLPVFLEEGRDMFPQLGENLRAWQSNPANSSAAMQVLRLLHTLKGSARMAGAMGLGQHMHEMETRIEIMTRSGSPNPAGLDEMLTRFDQGSMMFEELQNPELARRNAQLRAAAVAMAAQPQAADVIAEQPGAPAEVPVLVPLQSGNVVVPKFAPANAPVAKPAAQAAPVPLVRVRADILDRLVNQAGEVSISRSRIETEVGTLRQSLTEMTENVARLRDQLREIEMQAESQISSRMAHSGDREFDPLEFDRFTRLQELTRMMAESVNDVGSVQQNLARTVENATMDLTTQSRLTRDLQQDLMRVRMVQFASISERLYRVVRQASKELDKRVNLDIRGSAVEIDRGVLEKMTGPFEHLLRNSIVHGIETRDQRTAAGKSEIGELLVEIRQEGNEVVIQFSDDGAGLNLERIRSKALSLG
ncbi:MAG: Hpt domain-containing protein, partial [Burkholderiaceae bacterium]|nr:Hpt domain-containing protein [Burkholderiaceae bacterium]